MVICGLREIGYDLPALLEAFLRLVLRMMNPVRLGVVGSCLGDHVTRTELASIAEDFFQISDALPSLRLVGMDNVRIAGDAADRQILVAERVPDFLRLFLGDLPSGKVDVLEVQVKLHRVEVEIPNFLRGLLETIGEIAGKNSCLHHGR
jgi:hypothetical protein